MAKNSSQREDKVVPEKLRANEFLIVGIGASAGGIQALKEFFMNVPAGSGMAYVVILHLSPDHESQLAEILQTTATIPVTQVTEKIRVDPNHVYVIPPNKGLTMNDGHLELSDVTNIEERRAPVDIFFRTLAESQEPRAACVVLSGTGANGSMGLKRVKELGGVAFAQDPAEAEYNDMPRNSIATGLVDYVLPVAEIPAKIIAYRENLSTIQIPMEPAERSEPTEQALRDILTQLRVRTGHDFSNYKRATVLRRIERRISVRELNDLPAYAAFMREHPEEAQILLKDLLISVTNFFRDKQSFDALEREVIPKILEGKSAGDQVRVWIAGCATGEEAYSIAMLLAERTLGSIDAPTVQIFATDIDEQAIAQAREGYYTLNDAADVSPERLQRFFVKNGSGYHVRREIREMVLFAIHNVIKDPPFSRLDLASCRNVMIYLNRTAQDRVMEIIHFALQPGGFLFLGNSESVDIAGDLYAGVNKESHIFQSRSVPARMSFPVPQLSSALRFDQPRADLQVQETRALERLSYVDLHQQLLELYAPPSVVVTEDYEIVHMSENAGKYLQIPGGEPSYNLLKVVRPELRLDLRTALYQALQQRTNVEAKGLKVRVEEQNETVNVLVRPVLRQKDTARGFILVIFERVKDGDIDQRDRHVISAAEPVAHQLEEELIRVKAQLRTTVEQYEIQNEELKASNEELQAMNEELRSAAEELETGKEELQSLNEELTTVNQELKIKIEELGQSNNDMQNLINSTDIGTIFLDRSFKIKLFTPSVRSIFNLIPSDIGRSLMDITGKLEYSQLLADVELVLHNLQPVERTVVADGREYLMNILPYRTVEDHIGGVVLTFVDISERRVLGDELRITQSRLQLLTESFTDYAILACDNRGVITSWNTGAEHIFGFSEDEAVGRPSHIIFTPEDIAAGAPEKEMATAREKGKASDERFHIRKDGSRLYVSGMMASLWIGNELVGYAKIARDLTSQKKIAEDLQTAHETLEVRVGERTRELAQSNESLKNEIVVRKNSEELRVGLLRKIVTTQEDERRRIARDLHDHLGQRLTALRLKIASLKDSQTDGNEMRSRLERLDEIAASLDSEVNFLVWELRPTALDDLGMAAAISNYVREWSQHFNIPAEFHSTGMDGKRFDSELETNLYRITQEALNNTYKHAEATRASVLLEWRNDDVVLIVEDNGKGFDIKGGSLIQASGKGLGLVGMRERAALIGGTLEIESAPRKGVTIFARIPVHRGGGENG